MMKFQILNIKNLTEADFEKAFEGLSSERKQRCLRYKFLEDRRRMAFADSLLKKLIKEELKSDEISVYNLPSGKPVAKAKEKEIFVSITHSGDFVACAIADTSVGIDLEAKREIKPEFINRVLSEAELEFVKESDDFQTAFLKIWTAKEAYLKLTGQGLSAFNKAEVLPILRGESDFLLESIIEQSYVCTVIYKN